MSIKYVIEGSTVKKVEEYVTNMVDLDGLLPGLTSYVPLELSPMPSGLKYIIIEPKQGLELAAHLIVQAPAGPQRINYIDGRARDHGYVEPRNYRLSLPWGLFWFDIDGNRMVTPEGEQILWTPKMWGYMWSKDPYTTLDDTEVWPAMFPNCWTNGRVCFGTTSTPANLPLGAFVDHAVNNFWTSEFNNDLDRNWPYDSIQKWADDTAENPEAWREWGMWSHNSTTVREKLSALSERYDASGARVEWREAIPSSAQGAIPAACLTPTWYNLNEWLDNLNPEDYARFARVVQERENG